MAAQTSREVPPRGTDAPEDHPGFAVALVSVFAASFVVWLISRLLLGFTFVGFFPHVDVWLRLVLGSLLAAFAARFVLRLLGYSVSYVATVVALVVGGAVTHYLGRLGTRHLSGATLPFVYSWATVAGVLVSTWLLQFVSMRRQLQAVP